ncbi:hypothetical protein TUM20985_21060 [Mycobacterium antarcticum]|nr:hypothetical protein TUM20985_21060 [Mycolicibacterium sp. TUM20985]
MKHATHIHLMVGLGAAAILLLSTGNSGGWALYVGLGACAATMLVMMRGMGGSQQRGEMECDTPERSTDKSAAQIMISLDSPNLAPLVPESTSLRRAGRESVESGTW